MLQNIILMVPPLLLAVILHELAHAYVALRLGDATARNLGRISFNPIKHIDFYLTILVPGFLILVGSPVIFGGAKPVPVNPHNFENPRRGMMYVAAAGPIVNFILAGIFFLIFKIFFILEAPNILGNFIAYYAINWIAYSILINIVLGLFNLLPVLPLDGGRILFGILPIKFAQIMAKTERYGLLIVFLLIYLGIPDKVLTPVIEFIYGALQ